MVGVEDDRQGGGANEGGWVARHRASIYLYESILCAMNVHNKNVLYTKL